jgi:hypothetical protein
MKGLILFFALSVSLVLTSCSQLDQESSPVTPQINKESNPLNYETFPYEYLAAFPEMESVKWEEALSDGQWVIVTLNKTDREFHHIFCEVIYSDLTEPVEKISELYFAGKPEDSRFVFAKPENSIISDVRVYVVYDYPSVNEILIYNEIPFPYNHWQKFSSIYVHAWETKDKVISISAENDVNNSEHIFAQINSKEGNMLVFAAKPSSEFFDIPKYGDTGVMDVNLYGLKYVCAYDVE